MHTILRAPRTVFMTQLEFQSRLRVAASRLATDEELIKILDLTPEDLIRNRKLIDAARASALLNLKLQRAKQQLKRSPRPE